MLELNNSQWTELTHAYGNAGDIPKLLRELIKKPVSKNPNSEPLFSLWSALCHQGEAYSASFAAVPHLVAICKGQSERAHWSIAQLVVCIEIARLQNRTPKVAGNLVLDYETAIQELPRAIENMQKMKPDENTVAIGAAAFAVACGDGVLAESYLG